MDFDAALDEALDKADPEMTIAEVVGVMELKLFRLKQRMTNGPDGPDEPDDPADSWKRA